jgi:hypothetical protein
MMISGEDSPGTLNRTESMPVREAPGAVGELGAAIETV